MEPASPTVHAELASAPSDGGEAADLVAGKSTRIETQVPWAPTWGMMLGLSAVAATAALFAFHGAGRGMFLDLICLGTLLLAAAFDAAFGRIPNPLTYTAILLGLGVNLIDPLVKHLSPQFHEHWLGAAGAGESISGLLLFGGIGLAAKIISAMGGGDMKLLAAAGAMLGMSRATDALLCGMLIGVAYSLANLISRGRVNSSVGFLARRSLTALYPNARVLMTDPYHGPRLFPLAIPIFFGLLFLGLPPVITASAWLHGT